MRPSGSPPPAWRWLLAWAVPGALLGFAVAGLASIGLLLLPLGLVALLAVARRAPGREDRWGLLLGVGLAAAAIGAINLDYYAGTCPERDAVERLPGGGVLVEGCGGFDPLPFFGAGALAIAVARGA